ncbi:MAG TPA: hypothetical protein PLM98_10805 [Thiolinea sp.]|nr:hypothetical protein [Thiolinea sp.]
MNLIELTDFSPDEKPLPKWGDTAYVYCNFNNLKDIHEQFGAFYMCCQFNDCSWYWSLFNVAHFVSVNFKNCRFAGVSIAGCTFTECHFENCHFIADNLGSPCHFSDTRWYNCTQKHCKNLRFGL